jgi:hypothetical protein
MSAPAARGQLAEPAPVRRLRVDGWGGLLTAGAGLDTGGAEPSNPATDATTRPMTITARIAAATSTGKADRQPRRCRAAGPAAMAG